MSPRRDPHTGDPRHDHAHDGEPLSFGFDSPPESGERNESNSRLDARWVPRKLSTLVASGDPVEWVWEGYFARGFLTLIAGLWKAGKTTLLAYLYRALDPTGPAEFAGLRAVPVPVVVVTEESVRLWATRRDDIGIADHVSIISRPFRGRPKARDWEAFCDYLRQTVDTERIGLVVVDALANLWPVHDENDASQVADAVAPFRAVADAGAAVVFVHHPKKGDAAEGQASRGSGALPAAVDVIAELRRYDPRHLKDPRRVLTAFSRLDETPDELVIRFDKGVGYSAAGTKADASTSDRLKVVLTILRDGTHRTAADIRNRWPEECDVPQPTVGRLRVELQGATDAGDLSRRGGGVRADPYTYGVPSEFDSIRPDPLGAKSKTASGCDTAWEGNTAASDGEEPF